MTTTVVLAALALAAGTGPDLRVDELSDPPRHARPGDLLTVHDITVNAGRRRAGASETRYSLGRRAGLGARPVPALRKGAWSHGRIELQVPRDARDGTYRLRACADALDRVRERDERNNCRSSRRSVVIDTTAPAAPSIDERPDPVTEGERARIAFSGAETGLAFLCALDDAAPTPCSSPLELTGLASGDHTVRVIARDAAGNESEASVVQWTAIPEQATLGDGAWSWFADPRAVHHRGRTYVGWVAQDGDVKVSAYDHATLARTTALVASAVQADDHANPAVQILPDGHVRVFYSAHAGMRMWYRTSLAPEDVNAWGPAQTMPENIGSTYGFTYPNPVHLAAEGRTYLFWRGGDFNPAFTSQADGSEAWAPVRRLITVAGERPYVKYDSDGESTIHIAFTNAHPNEDGDVNIYYAAYRDGALRRADGTVIGPLGTAIVPDADNLVFDAPENAWIHDVAHDDQGRPVLVFAVFDPTSEPRRFAHRYVYARWTGERWDARPITAAGGSISEDPREPYYSGGITLDHEDPRTVYLSRQTGEGVWDVETWSTPDGGAGWTSEPVTAGSGTKNVRPVSPRGMLPFSGDMSVLWMRGRYPYYLTYQTSIATILRTGGDEPPVADAAPVPRRGLAPLPVEFDASASHDDEGPIAEHRWDFGDGTSASGAQAEHVYGRAGRYFPTLTVTDTGGRSDTYVTETVVDAGVATGPALELAAGAATLTGAVAPRDAATAHVEYGTSRTPDLTGTELEATIDGLTPGTTYRYRLVVTTAGGTVTGDERSYTADAPPSYREAVRSTPGLLGHWRLGDTGSLVAADALGARPGAYSPTGVTLGQPGALPDDPDTAAFFDGGEMTATTPPLTDAGTLEGWFQWQAGVTVLRDSTSMGTTGWMLAYDAGGMLACRAGGTALVSTTPVSQARDGRWHHLALTRDRDEVRLYLDGRRLTLGGGAPGTATAAAPWHVMRNGTTANQYARGHADEIAIYDRALTAADIRQRAAAGA
jgi:PKD repeat protein